MTRYSVRGLGGDDRGQLNHQPGPGVQAAVPQHLVEGEVVEGFDEFRVGHCQGGDAGRGEKLVMDSLGRVHWGALAFSWPMWSHSGKIAQRCGHCRGACPVRFLFPVKRDRPAAGWRIDTILSHFCLILPCGFYCLPLNCSKVTCSIQSALLPSRFSHDGEVGHGGRGRRAVPVLLAGLEPDNVAGTDGLDGGRLGAAPARSQR